MACEHRLSVGAEYPCCGVKARFTAPETHKRRLIKECRNCRKRWVVRRKQLRGVGGKPIDEITWKEAT